MSFVWCTDCQEAFDGVKQALTSAPVLVMPVKSKPFELIADACGFLPFCKRVVLLHSSVVKLYTAAERNYGVGEHELLAIVDPMRTWRCYLGLSADMLTVVC